MQKVYLYVLSIFLSVNSFAQTWTPLTGPFGGEVWDIEKTASGQLFAATFFGAYTSTDGGANWTKISAITNVEVQDFLINPTGRIYALCGGATNQLFVSDNGVDWAAKTISNATQGLTLRIQPANIRTGRIAINPANSQQLFVLGSAAIGNSPTGDPYLWRSIDGGDSWSAIDFGGIAGDGITPFPGNSTDFIDLAINSDGVVLLIGSNGTNTVMYRSLFGGANWGPGSLVAGFTASAYTAGIRLIARNSIFYAYNPTSVLRSVDGGITWVSISSTEMNQAFGANSFFGDLTFDAAGNLLVAHDNKLWICSNPTAGSPTWSVKGETSGWDTQKLLVGQGNDLFVASRSHGFTKSTDGGTSWTLATKGITATDPTDILVTSDDRIVITDQAPGWYLSPDGGATWQRNASPDNNSFENFKKIIDLEGDGILLLSSQEANLYTGSNTLTKLNTVPFPGNIIWNGFAFSKTASSNVIYAYGGPQVYRSFDKGANWTQEIYTGLPANFVINELEMDNLKSYPSDEGYIYLSGLDYQIPNSPVIATYRVKYGTNVAELITPPGVIGSNFIIDIQTLHVLNGDVVYMLTQHPGTPVSYKISYSSDHGTTWTTISPSIFSGSVPRKIDVITDATIPYKGENLMNVYSEGGKIFTSNDNGANWNLETYIAPKSRFQKMILTTGNYAYLAGTGLQLHKSIKPLLIPAKPTNLTVANFTFNRAILSWQDNSSVELVYTIEKSTGNNANYQVETQALTNSTSATFTNLLPNTTYFFRISATSAAGKSPYSNEVSFTTLNNNCPLTIPDNRSWTSTLQYTRGFQFASLSPAIHTNPDQQYTLTFDATGTVLEGAAKVYAHTGVILANADKPITSDPGAPWQYVKNPNFTADNGIGQMTAVPGQPNKWQLVLGPTLRSYYGVPNGTPIYWIGLVFRNGDGSVWVQKDGVTHDTFISIEKGSVITDAIISLTDQANRRYSSNNAPNAFFEVCGITTSANGIGTGNWDALSNTLLIREQYEDFPATGYVYVAENKSVLNSSDPAPQPPFGLKAYVRSQNSNLLTWQKAPFATKYKIERELSLPCTSDLSGTVSYVTTNMNAPDINTSSPGPTSGSVNITQVSPGVYTITDYSFGMYGHIGYGPPPATSSFRWTHACSSLIVTGGAFGETTWTYTITAITATQLTFNWKSNFNDAGTTVLTRSDGKSWLQLTPPSNFQQIAEVNYPAVRYVDNDPALVLGTQYAYRIAAINGAGNSTYSTAALATVTNTIFAPQESTVLNKIPFDGQGVVCADLDNDGLDDLIMATFRNSFGEAISPLFYKNNGNGDFTPVDVPSMAQENNAFYRGILVADFNNDNLPDVFCSRGDGNSDGSVLQDILLFNNGNFQFTKTKVTTRPGVSSQFNSAVALDFNNDGFLDLFVCNGAKANFHNFLLTNTGNGTFVQNTTAGTIVTDKFTSIEATTIDYDNDGDLDLAVSDYGAYIENPVTNGNGSYVRLYKNNSNGTFTSVFGQAFESITGNRFRTFSVGDVDNNGHLDLYTGGSSLRKLYSNTGGIFSELPSTVFSGATFYGSTMGDIDNDGDIDLIGVNTIYLNDGTGAYTEVTTPEAWTQNGNIGSALADFNNDGFLDLTAAPLNNVLPLTIFQNNGVAGSSKNWIKVNLKGTQSNRSAIGARVKVTTTSPSRTQIREVSSRTGYGSQSSLTQHFGLGTATTISSIEVRWPSGLIQTLPNVAANQTITITEDNSGPVVNSFTPANGSTGVVVDTNLEITFDESPVGVAGKKITITPTLPSGIAQTINATAATVNGNTVTVALSTPLNYLTQYAITIEAGAFRDSYGNPMDAFATGWSFTTIDNIPPNIISTEFATLVAKGFGSTKMSATVSDNVDVSGVTLSYRAAGSTENFVELPGMLTAGKWEFTVQESLYNTTGLEFYFTAKDVDNNISREPSTGVKQSLFETTQPTLQVPANPTLISKGFITRTFSVLATDNFAVSSVVMSYRNTKDGVVFTELSGIKDGTVANQYNFPIPETEFNVHGLEYFFIASDATGNTTRNPSATGTFQMLLDNKAPVVGPFTAPASIPKASVTVTVKAIDNLAVTSVVMKYRGISSKNFITSPPGVKNANGDYDFAVGADWFDNMGLEYYFRAVDASKNIGVSPDTTAAANKYYKTYIKFDGVNLPKLDLIKGSTGISGYQIVSVPLELSNKNIADNFEELGTADKTAYRFLRYRSTPTPGWDEYPGGGLSVLARGEGYFLNSLKAEQITLLDGVAPQVDQSNFFELSLKQGWNQIGNPYTVQIQWSDVIAYNKNPAGVSVKLTKYDNGFNTNDAEGIIEPYKGGFVKVDNDVKLKIPFKGFTSSGRTSKVESDLGQPNWELPFTLTQSNLTYQMGLVGMNRDALVTNDNYDLPMAPRLGDYIEASFDHPEHFMKQFSQDVVPTREEYTWELNVASNLDGEATMNWNNMLLGENSKEMYLLDMAMQRIVNMREVNGYRFDPKESKRFKLFFGENLETKIKPSKVALSKIYPNPTSGLTTISFALPEGKSNSQVNLEVFDIMGRKISTLARGTLLPGFYEAEWDAAQLNVTDGLYVCRLLVSNESGEQILTEKIVVKK